MMYLILGTVFLYFMLTYWSFKINLTLMFFYQVWIENTACVDAMTKRWIRLIPDNIIKIAPTPGGRLIIHGKPFEMNQSVLGV